MSELIIEIKKHERTWPGYTKRTRITGYGVGLHSMPSEFWAARVAHVGADRIDAAIRRGDLTVQEVDLTKTGTWGGES